MPAKIASPKIEKILLTKTDEMYGVEGDPSFVMIRQGLEGDREMRDREYNDFIREYQPSGSVTVKQTVSMGGVLRLEVKLTMVDCNLTDEDGKPFFTFRDGKVTEESFKKGWDRLPPEVADEIIAAVKKVNPAWDFQA
jgi:hypothetical protein